MINDIGLEFETILRGYADQGGTLSAANEIAALRELERRVRKQAFDEAAKVCETLFEKHYDHSQRKVGALDCASQIRALKP